MLELSQQVVGAEFVVNPCVQQTDLHSVHPHEGPHENEEGIVHDPEAHLAHGVAAVFQVSLEQIVHAAVSDRVFRTQFLVRNLIVPNLNGNLAACPCRQVQSSHVLDCLSVVRQEPQASLVCSAVGPVRDNLHVLEIFNFRRVLFFPDRSLLHFDLSRNNVNLVQTCFICRSASDWLRTFAQSLLAF